MFEVLAAIIGVYAVLIGWIVERFRRFLKLPREQRRSMSLSQRVLFLYGLYREPRPEPAIEAQSALTTIQQAWDQVTRSLDALEASLEQRQKQIDLSEETIKTLEERERGLSERIKLLKDQPPEVAEAFAAIVAERFQPGQRKALFQQIIISGVFFILGVASTLLFKVIVAI